MELDLDWGEIQGDQEVIVGDFKFKKSERDKLLEKLRKRFKIQELPESV